jgi:tight adherence protein C
MNIPITPLLIIVWLGFLGCLGLLLALRLTQNTFQQRMRETLSPTETDESMLDLVEEERAEEMNRSLAYRILAPLLKKMSAGMKGKANDAKGAQIREMLEQGGHPLGMHYPEFLALKTLSFFLMLGLGILSQFFGVPLLLSVFMPEALGDPMMRLIFGALWVMIFAYIGFSGPTFWLRWYVNKRIRMIRKAMADIVDLIVLAIEAGLGFDQAVGQAVEKTEGPLTDELRRVLDEVRVGRPQSDAFRAMAQRIRMQELSLLVAAIDQATKMGTGLATALRLQAVEIRERRMAYVREQAGKLPVKMMLPLVLFIFPALFVVILGPAGVQISEMMANGQF